MRIVRIDPENNITGSKSSSELSIYGLVELICEDCIRIHTNKNSEVWISNSLISLSNKPLVRLRTETTKSGYNYYIYLNFTDKSGSVFLVDDNKAYEYKLINKDYGRYSIPKT